MVHATALALVLFGGTACLHMKQELIIHRNGSARILLQYSLPTQAVEPVRQAAQSLGNVDADAQPAWWFNRDACAEALRDTGIDLERHRVYTADHRRHAVLQCRAEDLNAALGNGPLKSFDLSETPEGHLKLTVQMPGLQDPENLARLPDDLRIELIITTPTAIVATTGTQTEDRTAVWTVTSQTLRDAALPECRVEFKPVGGVDRSSEGQQE